MQNSVPSTGISAKLTNLQNGDNLQWSETAKTFINAPAGTGVIIATAAPATGDGTISNPVTLLASGVAAGSYTNPNITVDQYGLISTASNGTASVLSITNGTGITITGTATNPIVSVSTTAVTPGIYVAPTVTIDSTGRITAASSNTGFVTNVLANAGLSSSGGTTPTISLQNTAVTPGSYTNANITVDAGGRITTAANGTSGVTSILAGAGISVTGSVPTFTISLPNSGVTPNTYNYANITVDARGIVTGAASATPPVTSVVAGSGIVVTGTTTPTISLNNSGVTPGSYTSADITIDSFGRITAAANGGGGGVTSVTGGTGITVTGTTTPTVSITNVISAGTADTRAISYNAQGQITSTAAIQPKYDAIWSQNQTIPNNSSTQILANSLNNSYRNKTSPTNNTFSNGSFTAQKAGTYQISASALYSGSASGWRTVNVEATGVGQQTLASNTTNVVSASFNSQVACSGSVYLNAGDTARALTYQNSGGNLSGTFYVSIVYLHD